MHILNSRVPLPRKKNYYTTTIQHRHLLWILNHVYLNSFVKEIQVPYYKSDYKSIYFKKPLWFRLEQKTSHNKNFLANLIQALPSNYRFRLD